MITAINTKNEYGKQGAVGINLMSELSEDGGLAYAHSMEQAVQWIKSHKLFANVEPYSLGDGRLVFSSTWDDKPSMLDMLFGYDGVTHTRQTITLSPVDTVFESTGYKSPAVFSLE